MGADNLRHFVQRPFRGTQNRRTKRAVRWSAIGAVTGALAGTALAAVPTLASIFARTVVTPEPHPAEDVRIVAYRRPATPHDHGIVELALTSQTQVRGQYALVFAAGNGVARIGDILSINPKTQTVTRVVEEVYRGDLATANRGRWAGFVWPTPEAAGFDYHDVMIPVDNGLAPAWFIPPIRQTLHHQTWLITVHGRGSKRNEGLRMMGVAQRMGMPGLLISYRNDGEAPDAPDKRYGLGATEWPDVEAAILYALNNGATSVVLAGYSMGGAVSLQLVRRSALARYVRGLVLIGPVIDWLDVLRHQARINRVPHPVGKLGQWLIESPWGRTITGLAAPVDFRSLDWVTRSKELRHPTLILHSEQDDFVPVGPSAELARRNPQLVNLIRFQEARHTREWNVAPERFESAVLTWLHMLFNTTTEHRMSLSGSQTAE